MEQKLLLTNIIIHGFAAAHAVTAAALAQTMVGDELALTTLTVSMIVAISRLYGQRIEVSSALAFLGIFAGFYLGTRGAIFLIKWIPLVGNTANAIATTMTTETLGWVTYYVVSKGNSIKDIKRDEAEHLIEESKVFREKYKKEWETINSTINKMSDSDKVYYKLLLKRLQNKDLTLHEQKEIEQNLTELLGKYGLK